MFNIGIWGFILVCTAFAIASIVLFIRDGIQAKRENRKRKTVFIVLFILALVMIAIALAIGVLLLLLSFAIMRGM